MDSELPPNTNKQLAKIWSVHNIWNLSEGDLFTIPASCGEVHAILSGSVFQLNKIPSAILNSDYNGAWVFGAGDDIPQDVIPSTSVLVPRPGWLRLRIANAIKELGEMTYHLLISSNGHDLSRQIRPVFRFASLTDSFSTLCEILNTARSGFSVIQVWALLRPKSVEAMEKLKQFHSTHGSFSVRPMSKEHVCIF